MSKDVLKLALEALEWITQQRTGGMIQRKATEATTAIKQALEQPLQEPVAFFDWYDNAHWGNEDFKEGCHRSWNAAIKYTTLPAQEFVCSTGLCHYKPAAPVQELVASLKEADVLMIAEAHNIDPRTKGLYGFYIDCISSQPTAQPAPVHFAWMRYEEDCAGDPVLVLSRSAEEGAFRVYKEPAQRPWVGLTDRKVGKVIDDVHTSSQYGHHHTGFWMDFYRAIEAELKELNT